MTQAVVLILADNMDSAMIRASILKYRAIESRVIQYGPHTKSVKLAGRYDLVLVDSYYNSEDALSLCRHLRAESTKPLLLLTHEFDTRYHLDVYAAGVDECITNTVSVLLFLAKIMAWMQRSRMECAQETKIGSEDSAVRAKHSPIYQNGFIVDPKSRQVSTREGHAVKLSALEYRLFDLFLTNPGRVLETNHLLSKVWNNYEEADARLLTNLVYRLRQKLAADPIKLHIKTVDRIGYVYE